MLVGIDTGGTFTDFVLVEGECLRVHKVLSTPAAPEVAILQGLRELGVDTVGLRVVHGSTVATNAVLEGRGVRTALITNRGFADLLTIGRQARAELYDLQPPLREPPVPPELCLQTGGRLGADGVVVEPLTEADLADLRLALKRLAPRAVAINLLFSFLDERFERAIEAIVPRGVFVCRSSEVLPEEREYERGVATWLNAWIGPRVAGYLERLEAALAPAPVAVLQSSGDAMDAAQAVRHAVRLLLSGPAGGLRGARFVGEAAGCRRLLTFDMGGTSTDVALIDGTIALTSEGRIGGYPVAVPMVDMHTIGAGGGSLASVDAGGLLQVGPRSAGADPGPACYGRGGHQATVTDANLVLGRLVPEAFLGGTMPLDAAAARAAVQRVAEALRVSLHAAAAGIVRLADEHMAQALRVISVQRGIDPRDFTLVSFGGAGGLHVCALAEALGMDQALVPVHGGVLSALGMLVSPPGRELSRTFKGLLTEVDEAAVAVAFADLEAVGREALAAEGVPDDALTISRGADLRYRGQSYTLTLPWECADAAAAAFHGAHEQRFGHRLDEPVELVNLRLGVRGTVQHPPLASAVAGGGSPITERAVVYGCESPAAVFRREALVPGTRMLGPALILERIASTYLAPGWHAWVHGSGSLLLTRR